MSDITNIYITIGSLHPLATLGLFLDNLLGIATDHLLSEMSARPCFALLRSRTRSQKRSAEAQRKDEHDKSEAPSAREKGANSSFCRITLKPGFRDQSRLAVMS
jgi:hypothetical protein